MDDMLLFSSKTQDKPLSIFAGEQNLPELIVLQCLLLDVANITVILNLPD
jgi:hypothetical protein